MQSPVVALTRGDITALDTTCSEGPGAEGAWAPSPFRASGAARLKLIGTFTQS